MGVNDVFDIKKANLKGICAEPGEQSLSRYQL